MSGLPEGVTVRAAAEGDLAAIHAIERRSFGDPWSLEGFRDLLDHPRAKMEVAVGADGTVLGYAVAWYVADESEIANLAVAAGARQEGCWRAAARPDPAGGRGIRSADGFSRGEGIECGGEEVVRGQAIRGRRPAGDSTTGSRTRMR